VRTYDLNTSSNYVIASTATGYRYTMALFMEAKLALQKRFGFLAKIEVMAGRKEDFRPGAGWKVYARTEIKKDPYGSVLTVSLYEGTDGSVLTLCCSGIHSQFGLKRVSDFLFIRRAA